MIVKLDKSKLTNCDIYAEDVANECKFFKHYEALNKTTHWISVHGSNYPNWVGPTQSLPLPSKEIDDVDFGLNEELLKLNPDGISYAQWLGLNVYETTTNLEIVSQLQEDEVLVLR